MTTSSRTNLSQASAKPHTRHDGADDESARRRSRTFAFLEAYALFGLLCAVFAFFSFYSATSESFPTVANLQLVFGTQSVLALVALGALIPLICKEWDLSVGASAGLSAVVCAELLSNGTAIPVSIAIGILLGTLVGIVNALLITQLRTNAVITTLGTAAVVAGVVSQVTGGAAQVSNIPDSVTSFGAGNWLGMPRPAWILAIVAIGVYYLLVHTPFGRYVYALGSNREASRLIGLKTDLMLAMTFVAAGTLAGIAGVLQVARAGGADPRVGEALTLPALAAAFLSAAAIKPGRYNVGGVLVALFLIAFINSGLNLAGAQPYVSQYVNGLALIIGVGLAVTLSRKRAAA